MKKRNITLAALLVVGGVVLAVCMVLVVVPQVKSGMATDVSERTQVIQEEIQQQIDQYSIDDAVQDSIVRQSLEQTKEIVEEAQEIAGLK